MTTGSIHCLSNTITVSFMTYLAESWLRPLAPTLARIPDMKFGLRTGRKTDGGTSYIGEVRFTTDGYFSCTCGLAEGVGFLSGRIAWGEAMQECERVPPVGFASISFASPGLQTTSI